MVQVSKKPIVYLGDIKRKYRVMHNAKIQLKQTSDYLFNQNNTVRIMKSYAGKKGPDAVINFKTKQFESEIPILGPGKFVLYGTLVKFVD